ncbi:MobF family relaxase [Acinetobacter baumannii]|uniref:Conjugative relaxase domain protein, TrwC/TraI family n=7 Tax=Acinetobacter baumannii TaxID=470 RepID=A0A0C4Y9C6_ACIBA|nr:MULTISPECIES: MobF family relaxase [Acinetobacter calcoaceticus/baumannii complex]AFI97447.1 conjugative relaxase domain protein, TrwC/TraI family [Acinetobacter baumannii MDR-TJ]AJF79917.1 conjugative relaxase domain protein, TrwC/TraI family [Acinetobacter baumannii]APF45759.1 relaxase [Acinetobacter baumannii]APM50930.1 relaxase [Acinetobacter baumannii]KJG90440.1 conjugative relaxase domain-containing protein [Acinetobacter baumannii]
MIGVNNVSETGQALKYYQLDNYYTNSQQALDQTEWYGQGAQILGIEGEQVDSKTFADLLNGKIDDQQLGRVRVDDQGNKYIEHRAAMDITFSAPKSVSILAEVYQNQDVLEAHQNAVKETLSTIEENFVQTRLSEDGQKQKVDSDNLIVALFNHNTSRALDPQTHTHAVVMNATFNDKDTWSSISNEAIYANQSVIGSIYNANLANNLKELGLDLEVKDNKGNFEIAGFSPEVLEEFSQRRKQIIDSLSDRGIDIGDAPASLREQAALKTRDRKKGFDEQELRESWKSRASELGISDKFIDDIRLQIRENKLIADPQLGKETQPEEVQDPQKIPQTRDNQLDQPEVAQDPQKVPQTRDNQLDQPEVAQDPQKVPQMRDNQLDQPEVAQDPQKVLQTRDNQLDQPKSTQEPENQKPNRVRPPKRDKPPIVISEKTKEAVFYSIGHHTEREMMINENKIIDTAMKVAVGETDFLQVKAELDRLKKANIIIQVGNRITTKKLATDEVWSLEHIKSEKGSMSPILNEKAIKDRINQEEKLRGKQYTAGQRDSIETILTSDSRYVAVDGLAGTGKTTLLHTINKIASENGFIVRGMAATGVAAKNLEMETGIESKTIAMFQFKANDLLKQAMEQGVENRKPEIWIIDESSFVGQNSFKEILSLSKQLNTRVVFLGDKNQLQAINAGKPFELAQNTNSIDLAKMHNILRQKNQELKDVVTLVVAKNDKGEIDLSKNAEAFDLLDSQKRIHEFGSVQSGKNKGVKSQLNDNEDIHLVHKELIKSYMSNDAKGRQESLIITPFNSDRVVLNALVREEMRKANELHGPDSEFSILINTNYTEPQRSLQANYERGMVVRFQKNYADKDGQNKIFKGQYLKVLMKNKDGTLTLEDKDKNQFQWNPKKKSNSVEVYKEENRKVAIGDTVRFTRTKEEEDIKNGERYKIKGLTEDHVKIEDQAGNEKLIDKGDFKHWDYGYSNTVYSSQGLTKGNVFLLLNSRKIAKDLNDDKAATKVLGKAFGTRSFYVAVTREEHNLQVFTDNKNASRQAITFKQDKSSFVEAIQKANIEIPTHLLENEELQQAKYEIDR